MIFILFWSIIAFASTLAGSSILLLKKEWVQKNIWRVLAFASGILLSVSFAHILPEAIHYSPRMAGIGVVAAFLILFSIEEFTMMHSCSEYAENCSVHLISWTAFAALALHSFMDGAAITIAFQKDVALGQTVSSAICIHKLSDGLTLTGLLLTLNYSSKKCLSIVSLLGLVTPIGAILIIPFSSYISDPILGGALGIIAGIFFYIGAADILPRIHKVKDLICWVAFVIGLLLGSIQPH